MFLSLYNVDVTLKLNRFHSLTQELQQLISTNDRAVLEHLDHINSLLHNAVLTCKAATVSVIPDKPFKEEDHFAPGQKLQHQWRFSQTTKTPGRKKKGTVLRYYFVLIQVMLVVNNNRHANRDEQEHAAAKKT